MDDWANGFWLLLEIEIIGYFAFFLILAFTSKILIKRVFKILSNFALNLLVSIAFALLSSYYLWRWLPILSNSFILQAGLIFGVVLLLLLEFTDRLGYSLEMIAAKKR